MYINLAGRIFMALGFLIFFLLFTFQAVTAFAEDFHVVQVTRNLQMHEGEKVFRDYYINAGKIQGLKEGMLVPVRRRLTVQDSFRKIIDDNVMIDVAKIKLISVQEKVSIGRVVETEKNQNRALLEFAGIMTGDKVDVMAAEMPKKSAAVVAPGATAVAKSTDGISMEMPSEEVVEESMDQKRNTASVKRQKNTEKRLRVLPEKTSSSNNVPILTQ